MLLIMFIDISCDMSEVSIMNNCAVVVIAYKPTNAYTRFCREGTHGKFYYYLSN